MRLNRLTIITSITLLAGLSYDYVRAARGPALGQVPVSQQTSVQLTVEQALQDFDVLRKALEEAHGGLYRYNSKSETDKYFAALRARITAPLSDRAFRALIADVIARGRDGHARLEYDSVTTAGLTSRPLLPIRVALEDERMVVVSNDTPSDSTIIPGMEVLSINRRSPKVLLEALLPLIPGDGFIMTGKRARFARNLPQNLFLYVDSSTTFKIVARSTEGKSASATLVGVNAAERAKNNNPINAAVRASMAALNGEAGNVTLSMHAPASGGSPTIARIKVRAFDGASFNDDVDAAIRTAREQSARSIILDLRGNGGGVDLYGAYLVSRFLTQPFRYFDRIHLSTIAPTFATWKASTFEELRNGTVPDANGGHLVKASLHAGVEMQPPAEKPFTGSLIVLIDGESFSTTADVAATLHHHKRARFVGEETAGGYSGNTSGLNAQITLPNSKLRLKIMMYDYYNAVSAAPTGSAMWGRGTIPDEIVTRRMSDVLNRTDAPLSRAIAMLSSTNR